ncbi:trypsin-like [Aphidius gifuensis]|uniref:trypsin-like n=1 Tax=Aphidius gifuensis TaxID=684658 RepID=UPI001CDD58A3|nr:trypsin-like [Aphidius gifuensis]
MIVGDGKKANKLVGGIDVDIDDYSFYVSLRLHHNNICGGSMINENHILTTASCITLGKNIFLSNIEILIGSNDIIGFDAVASFHDVSLVIIHPEYKPVEFWKNDISILRVMRNIKINLQVVLPSIEFLYERFHLEIIGWGKPPLPFYIERLEKLNVYSILRTECSKYFRSGYILSPGQSCILPSIPAASFIKGDGGNPIITVKENHIVGMISAISIYHPNLAIYTKVIVYVNWINDMIENY